MATKKPKKEKKKPQRADIGKNSRTGAVEFALRRGKKIDNPKQKVEDEEPYILDKLGKYK